MAAERLYDDPSGDDGAEVALPKGDVTEGVVRVGDTVRRPHQPTSPAVAAYLGHLQAAGFDVAPRYLGRDARGRDVLDFVAGEVAGAPLPAWAAADELLASVGRLLRRLHDASAAWRPDPALRFAADLVGGPPQRLPGGPRLVSHNDATPQNVVVRDGTAFALVDFDLAGWTTRLTDLATTAMYWVPLRDPVDRDPALRDADVAARLEVLLDAYGLPGEERDDLLDAAALRFAQAWERMRWNAEHLGGGWARMWDEGVGDAIRRRVDWFARERLRLLRR